MTKSNNSQSSSAMGISQRAKFKRASEKNPELANLIHQSNLKNVVKKSNFKKILVGFHWWPRNAKIFIKKLSGPSMSQFLQMLRIFMLIAFLLGGYCYLIKIIYMIVNNVLF